MLFIVILRLALLTLLMVEDGFCSKKGGDERRVARWKRSLLLLLLFVGEVEMVTFV